MIKFHHEGRFYVPARSAQLGITAARQHNIVIIRRAVLATHHAQIIAIFPAGNDIDLKHRLMIIIFNIFFKF